MKNLLPVLVVFGLVLWLTKRVTPVVSVDPPGNPSGGNGTSTGPIVSDTETCGPNGCTIPTGSTGTGAGTGTNNFPVNNINGSNTYK